MQRPLQAGTFRILLVSSAVVAQSAQRGCVTWTVTIKLADVEQLRRLAANAHPEEAESIADSLAADWRGGRPVRAAALHTGDHLAGPGRSSSTCPRG